MNPGRIHHHRLVVRRAADTPSEAAGAPRTASHPHHRKRPSTAGGPDGTLSNDVADRATTATCAPSAPSTPLDPKPSMQEATSRSRFGNSAVKKTSSGRVVIETLLSPREVTMDEPFQPRVLYHHSQAYRWCPRISAEDEAFLRTAVVSNQQHVGEPQTMGSTAAHDAVEEERLHERLRLSEQRVLQRRTPRRPHSASLHTNEPPSLQLLVARLRGEKRSTLLDTKQLHPESDAQRGEDEAVLTRRDDDEGREPSRLDANPLNPWSSAIKTLERLQPGSADTTTAARVTATTEETAAVGMDVSAVPAPVFQRPPRHGDTKVRSRTVSMHSAAYGSNDGVSDVTMAAPTNLSKTEAAVMAAVLERREHLKADLMDARSDIRRMELQEELDELGQLIGHCRSLVAHVNMSHLHERSEFHASLLIDQMSSEALEGRLLYGETLRKLVVAQQRARREALNACVSAKSGTPRVVERMESARERRMERFGSTMATRLDANEAWRARADASTTLSYQGRIAMCERQAEDRRATQWFSLMLLFSYPRNLIAQRAARLERLLLSKKRKEEHVAHFVSCMRDCLHRRRARIARRKLKVLQFAFRLLVAYADHKRRRAAVGEIVAWYHEYTRHKPATDMVQKFKKAIIRCQTMCRRWLQRRRAEVAWTLLKLFQRGENYRWTPPSAPPGTVAPIHRVRMKQSNSNPAGGPPWMEPLIETVIKHVIPPFQIRLEVIRERWREHSRAYVAALVEHLHKNRMDKKRHALLARRGGYREHDAISAVIGKVPQKRVRPMHNIIPTDDMVEDIAAAVEAKFTVWLREQLLHWIKTQQQQQQLQQEQQQVQPLKKLVGAAASIADVPMTDEERAKKSMPSLLVVGSWVRDPTEPKAVAMWGPWVWHAPIGATVIAVDNNTYATQSAGGAGARRKNLNPSLPAGRVPPSVGVGGTGRHHRHRLTGEQPVLAPNRSMAEAVYLYQRALRML